MYLVPENQRNHYLREISMLAKALNSHPRLEISRAGQNLDDVRHYLLDLIETTKGTVGPDARAKLIRLQTRPSRELLPARELSNLIVEPVTLVASPGLKHIVLTQSVSLGEILDSAAGLIERIESDGMFQNGGWRVVTRDGRLSRWPGCI